jgi:4-hydroxyacetophenone monooxygenase
VVRSTSVGPADQVQFETEVLSADYDEEAALWTVVTRKADGSTERHVANIVISAVGSLNRPRIPEVAGRETFRGVQFHSNLWPDDCDLRGKRVAIVGVGASAQQIVPEIAPEVGHLTIFQRSPQWAAPFVLFRQSVPDAQRTLLEAATTTSSTR